LGVPANIDKKELVRNHMAWIVTVDLLGDDHLEITYASEGFFNSVMANTLEVEKSSSDYLLAILRALITGIPIRSSRTKSERLFTDIFFYCQFYEQKLFFQMISLNLKMIRFLTILLQCFIPGE
jgi:hypothetical protein